VEEGDLKVATNITSEVWRSSRMQNMELKPWFRSQITWVQILVNVLLTYMTSGKLFHLCASVSYISKDDMKPMS
jgi:hypothetical protein